MTEQISAQELDRMLLALRARGMSYAALAVVADVVFGWRITQWQIRARMQDHLGVPRGAPRKRTAA